MVGLSRRNFDRQTSFGRFWRLLDALSVEIVQKAKASSVLVGLRERTPSTLLVDAFSTLSLGPFFRPFQVFGLAALSPRDILIIVGPLMARIPEGPSDARADFTSKRRQKNVQNRKT